MLYIELHHSILYYAMLHPVSVRRFPSFRTQPLEHLSVDSVNNGFLSNPAPGEDLPSGSLVMETGCRGHPGGQAGALQRRLRRPGRGRPRRRRAPQPKNLFSPPDSCRQAILRHPVFFCVFFPPGEVLKSGVGIAFWVPVRRRAPVRRGLRLPPLRPLPPEARPPPRPPGLILFTTATIKLTMTTTITSTITSIIIMMCFIYYCYY